MESKKENDIQFSHKSLINDVKNIINNGKNNAYSAINNSIINTYWNIGKRIVDEEQDGENRAIW